MRLCLGVWVIRGLRNARMGFFRRRQDRLRNDSGEPSNASPPGLQGRVLREDDLEAPTDNDDRTPNFVFFLSLAFFAVSAMFFTIQRYLAAINKGDGRKQLHARRALVLKLPLPKRQQNPYFDENLSFVVSEESSQKVTRLWTDLPIFSFKLEGVEMAKMREGWRASMSDIPRSSQIVEGLLRTGGRCLGLAHTEPVPFR